MDHSILPNDNRLAVGKKVSKSLLQGEIDYNALFEYLYRCIRGYCFQKGIYRFNLHQLLEDAVSDSILSFLEKKDTRTFANENHIKSYVYKAARNNLLKALEREKRIVFYDDDILKQIGEIYEMSDPDFSAYAEKSMRSLKPNLQQALIMRMNGATYEVIAERLAVQISTAHKYVKDAKRELGMRFREYVG